MSGIALGVTKQAYILASWWYNLESTWRRKHWQMGKTAKWSNT